jgi:hypothetical protein
VRLVRRGALSRLATKDEDKEAIEEYGRQLDGILDQFGVRGVYFF